MQRLGVPLCLACGKYPRRTNSKFCGSLCEAWAVQREQQLQLRQEPHPQQEYQQWHQQNQPHQHVQPSSMGSPSVLPNPGAVTWSNAARTSALPNNASPHSRQGLGTPNSHVLLDRSLQYTLIDALTKLAYVDECIGCKSATCYDGIWPSCDQCLHGVRFHPRTQPHHAASFPYGLSIQRQTANGEHD